jgi:hypothetical protein
MLSSIFQLREHEQEGHNKNADEPRALLSAPPLRPPLHIQGEWGGLGGMLRQWIRGLQGGGLHEGGQRFLRVEQQKLPRENGR